MPSRAWPGLLYYPKATGETELVSSLAPKREEKKERGSRKPYQRRRCRRQTKSDIETETREIEMKETGER